MSSGIVSTDAVTDAAEEAFQFGPFTLRPAQRTLTEGLTPIQLGSRPFEILLFLLERAGTFVNKNELVARVWPTTVVVEGNLRVNVTTLRKALGDGRNGRRYIVSVPNRGYSFVAPVTCRRASPPRPIPATATKAVPGMVTPLHRIVGRDTTIESLRSTVCRHRLVTIVGAGGIGKTTVAVSVAAAAAAEPAPWLAVHFVDLAPLSEARLVAGTLAAVLGLTVAVDDALSNILAFLHDKSLLLLLDNCEHVLTEVARLTESILRAAPRIHILATSREPLNADGERIQRLQPLGLPPAGTGLAAVDAMRFGAIELFVDRATAMLDTYELQDADVPCVVDICRHLDGIPLAIELAAAFMPSLGVNGIRAALERRFLQDRPGRRTTTPRHRTMWSMIDWSFGLLSPRQRTVLARVSVFCGSFTLDSACAVASDPSSTPAEVFDAVTELVAKSLVAVDASGDPAYFRLLETTHWYAADKLAESGELPALRRRHAEHVLELLSESEKAWRDADAAAWRSRFGRHLDDVRTAIAWAMSADGDVGLGIAMTVRSALLLFQISRVDEAMRFASAAMSALEHVATLDPQLEFELHLVNALLLIHTRGALPAMQRSLDRALEMALERGERRQLLLASSTNWLGAFVRSDASAMHEFAQRFEALTAADADPRSVILCDRMKAHTLHVIGDQVGARMHAERALAAPRVARQSFLTGAFIDRGVTMEMLLGRVLWLQGLPDQAERAVQRALERARSADGQSVALTYVLALAACPLAMWTGHLDLARDRVTLLLRHTVEHSLVPWRGFGVAFESLLNWHEDGRKGHPALPQGFDIRAYHIQLAELLATLHSDWADEFIFQRGDAGDAGWCQAELLRVRAERARTHGQLEESEALFLRSLDRARRDGAVSWELRTAMSLARVYPQERHPEALEILRTALSRTEEGRDTADVQQAMALYDTMASRLGRPGRRGRP